MAIPSAMDQTVEITESKFDFTEMMMTHVGQFTVGFVSVGVDCMQSRGSGTLVRFGNVAGVLTCAHVLDDLRNESEIGILCFPVRPCTSQTLTVKLNHADAICIRAGTWNEFGPDLAFLKLPEQDMGKIERLASVINGNQQRASAILGEPATKNCVTLVCGVIDERTQQPLLDHAASITPFEALVNVGCEIERSQANGHELIQFKPVTGEGISLPSSYKGTSGGGLWRVYLKPEPNNAYSLVQARLAGVAFWEKPVNNELHIICHGQSSIYDVLFKEICMKWPNGNSI